MGCLKIIHEPFLTVVKSPANDFSFKGKNDAKAYRYGFNGMEKDDEVKGSGNSYTTEFRQYDSRLGRRWNIDPVVKHHESPYATFANNPIWFADKDGLDTLMMHKQNIESPSGHVFSIVTFSIIQDGKERKLSESMFLGSNANYRQLPENSYFRLLYKPMGNHPEWKNTLYIDYNYSKDQVGMFIHPGPPHWNNGCLAISCEFPITKVTGDGYGGKYNSATFTVAQGIYALSELENLYSQYEGLLTGDKFLLKTNSEAKTDYVIEKAASKTVQSIQLTSSGTTSVLNTDGSSSNYDGSNTNATQESEEDCD
jgi:RHS repeat-associated protein